MADKDVSGHDQGAGAGGLAVHRDHGAARARRGAEELAAEIREHASVVPVVIAAASPEAAVARALEHAPRAVAAGSIYMIGPLRARLIAAGRHPGGSAFLATEALAKVR